MMYHVTATMSASHKKRGPPARGGGGGGAAAKKSRESVAFTAADAQLIVLSPDRLTARTDQARAAPPPPPLLWGRSPNRCAARARRRAQGFRTVRASTPVASGTWYCEFVLGAGCPAGAHWR